MTNEEAGKILEDAVSKLGEFFEAVQIIVSWVDEEGATHYVPRGSGNWYARQHMCQEFVGREKSAEIADQIGKVLKEDEL